MGADQVIEDLDALIPQPVFIKFGGETYELKPPKTGDLLRINALGQKMQTADTLIPEEVEKLVNDLSILVKSIVPPLADKELTDIQLFKLVRIISEMAVPPDSRAMAEKKITPADTDGPKDVPTS